MTWTKDDLARIATCEELELASRRPDGSVGVFVTMWVVRAVDELYVRSAGGSNRPWYRRALASGNGVIRAGGIERSVSFSSAAAGVHDAVDAAYHAKYDRYWPRIVGSVVGTAAHDVTIRLDPTEGPLT